MILSNVLIIFIKYPQAGEVKMRLAKTVGKEKAALIYKKLVELTLAKTRSEKYKRIIFFTPESRSVRVKNLLGRDLEYHSQEGDDIGERMANAFRFVFDKGAKRAVLIGSDCPSVDECIVKQAFTALDQFGSVIGPANDGGYYLIGLSKLHSSVFEGVSWSTNKVMEETLGKLRRSALTCSILEKFCDVDREVDLISNAINLESSFKSIL